MTGPFLLPDLAPVPQVMRAADLEYGSGRVLLLIVAHADDPAIFAGGVLRLFVQAGWVVHALRVTDDRWDSVGLDEGETRSCRESCGNSLASRSEHLKVCFFRLRGQEASAR
jgi:hypothetical protein